MVRHVKEALPEPSDDYFFNLAKEMIGFEKQPNRFFSFTTSANTDDSEPYGGYGTAKSFTLNGKFAGVGRPHEYDGDFDILELIAETEILGEGATEDDSNRLAAKIRDHVYYEERIEATGGFET